MLIDNAKMNTYNDLRNNLLVIAFLAVVLSGLSVTVTKNFGKEAKATLKIDGGKVIMGAATYCLVGTCLCGDCSSR